MLPPLSNKNKGIKDPIHGNIIIDDLLSIIDTPIFQRLGRVKQLTSAEYFFPGARHTRKDHCIGAMFLSSKYSQALGLNAYDKKVIEVASLLHDIGHGPYSHSWDTIVYSLIYPDIHKGHDMHRHNILNTLLKDAVEKMVRVDDIVNVWNDENLVLSAILQGPLGVDRMDYIKRDIHYTATNNLGYINSDTIINNSSIYIKACGTRVLSYNETIIPDIINLLNLRLHMYNRVYLQEKVIAASILVEAAIKLSVSYFDLVDKTKDLNKFIYLTDSIIDIILSYDKPEFKESKYYSKRFYNRELPKLLSEEIVYLKSENIIEHLPHISIEGSKIVWTSRLLSNDFVSEFDKYDIHISGKDGTITFKEYWHKHYPYYQIERYYIKRVYLL